jgi:hypothetical protein
MQLFRRQPKKCCHLSLFLFYDLFVPVTSCVLQKVLKQELSQGIRSQALGTEILSNIFKSLVSESSFAASPIWKKYGVRSADQWKQINILPSI